MAVDILVMTLARYLSGNYVTPVMEQAWAEEGVYRLGRPGAVDEIPPGVPLGGLQAEARCASVLGELQQRLAEQPELAGAAWEETAAEPAYFQRVEHEPLFALRWEAAARAEAPPSWLRRLVRRVMGRRPIEPVSPLAAATVFLPTAFDEPFELETPQGLGVYDCGSLPRLIEELTELSLVVHAGTPEAEALAAVLAAAQVASEAGLPLILDL